MIPLEIPKRSTHCSQGHEILTGGSDYYSVLLEDLHTQGLQRQDFCLKCWEQHLPLEKQSGIKSYWKARVPLKQEDNDLQTASQNERIMTMLKEALAADNSSSHSYAFVLALYLARKRQLALRQEIQQGNNTFFLYEVQATEEMISVPKVSLTMPEIVRIQKELSEKILPKS